MRTRWLEQRASWGLVVVLASACSEVTVGATNDQPDATATPDRPEADATVALDRVTVVDSSTIDVVSVADRGRPSDGAVEECLMCGGEAGARCVDLLTDENHCGGCNRWCSEWDDCVGGSCRTRCSFPAVGCGGGCVTLQTDANHCGMCGRRCCPGSVCSAGRCTFGCSAGTLRCCASADPSACDCSCRDPSTDRSNCGACGTACALGQICQAGRCVNTSGCGGGGATCAAGLCACSGRCSDLRTDVANCGRCGELCAVGEACFHGACTPVVRDAGAPTPDV